MCGVWVRQVGLGAAVKGVLEGVPGWFILLEQLNGLQVRHGVHCALLLSCWWPSRRPLCFCLGCALRHKNMRNCVSEAAQWWWSHLLHKSIINHPVK